jgi:ribulose-phosphate 3-epimerase
MEGQIIPAILVRKYEDMEREVTRAKKVSNRVQLDICDGVFVESKTWPFTEVSLEDFAALGQKSDVDLYLPFWEDVDYTVDMMVADPFKYIETLAQYGCDDVAVHFRSLEIENKEEYFEKIVKICDDYNLSLNLAMDLKTDFLEFCNFVKKFSEHLNYLQVMGIKEIGKQGEVFDKDAAELIFNLKSFLTKGNIDLPIFVDGGMNAKSIEICKDAGAEVFVVGSALGKAVDYEDKFEELNNI